VLRGDNGKVLPKFPLKTNDQIIAPVLLVNLTNPSSNNNGESSSGGLHLIVPSFDGYGTTHTHIHQNNLCACVCVCVCDVRVIFCND